MEIKIVREKDLFKGNQFHLFIYNKTESVTGLHQHDYYEYTIVLTGRYYQKINGKRVLLERGDLAFIPIGSSHQSFYDFGEVKIINVGVSQALFERYYSTLLPSCVIASQAYRLDKEFISYIERAIASLTYDNDFSELLENITFHVVNRLHHYKEQQSDEDIPQWLVNTVQLMLEKSMFSENALANMVQLSGRSQAYLTRATQRYYKKTPMQIINEIRINFAKKQLEITNNSVGDIAYEAGYSDVSLFIKNFKKLTSFTPGNYRKNSANLH